MKVLIVGGAGLIGSKLERILNEAGEDTLVLDNFTSNSVEHMDVCGEVITGNACSFTAVNRTFAYFKPDVVFIFASSMYNKNEVYDACQESDTLVSVVNNVIRCAAVYGIGSVFLGSSGEVYKGGSKRRLKEISPVVSLSYTGACFSYAETALQMASVQYGFKFTSLRFFGVCGARKFLNPKTDLVSFFVDSVCNKDPIAIVGYNLYTDILDFSDAAEASYIIYRSAEEGVVNIGSSEPIKLIDLYDRVFRACGVEGSRVFKVRPKEQTRTLVSDNTLLTNKGWKKKISLEQSIARILELRGNK